MFDAHLTNEEIERLMHSLLFVIKSDKHRMKFQQITMDANQAKWLLNRVCDWSSSARKELQKLVAADEKSR